MKLFGTVTAIHLDGNVDIQAGTPNGGTGIRCNLTCPNEGKWALGDSVDLNFTIAKSGTAAARTAVARAARAGG